ncbi:calcium:proton antiporter [Micrococcus terreus]|uniref:calcium:proton antiporter n=1 Tax=Micrococcus terreus TaxID=574650 RepID=UPI003016EE80
MSQTHTTSRILTPIALVRLALGWGAVVVLALSGPLLEPPVATPLLVSALAVIIGVIVLCSFGVVKEAEQLAHRLGDPYGTLVLTLSIVLIEVVLISAVMLGPGEHTTIARDSVMAVSMIILNAVVGASLLVGGLRHGDLRINRTGTSSYLALLIPLLAVALVLPVMIGQGGAYTGGQAITVIVLTLALYACFLVRQMGVQAGDFREVTVVPPSGAVGVTATSRPAIRTVIAEHRSEILARVGLLVATVLPIVLLSHDMSALLDDGLGRTGAPVALTGLLIAVIVFLPESITSVRAALPGEAQRVVNLCHGALVSTVGLTIPAVLVIGMLTGHQVVLAESAANLVMLGVTLLLSVTTLAARRVTALHGAAHLVVFAVYVLVLFS